MNDKSLMCLNMQMLRASHLVLKTYEDAYRPYGIRATQVPVLNLLANEGLLSIKQIADLTITERSVLSRKLAVMEQNGWVTKLAVSGTQQRLYQITPLGHEKLAQIEPIRHRVQQQLTDALNDEEKAVLSNLCDKLTLASNKEDNA